MLRTALPHPAVPAAGLMALALALSGCGVTSSPARAMADEPSLSPNAGATASATVSATPTATASPRATTSPRATATATPSPRTPAPPPTSRPRPTTSPTAAVDVTAVQRRLAELHYYAGPVDGRSGPATRSAVMAFQKVNGLAADGTVGRRTLAALRSPRAPQLRRTSPADRVEVDLDRQVLYVVQRGKIVRIMPVSSGSGETYREADGTRARALTPVGTYRIQRRIVGLRQAPLGSLYDPQYFYRGWAIHGSNSVPARPASHGCVRVTRADAKALLRLIGVGTTVHLYGGRHVFSAGSSGAGTSAPAA